ncbi:MAG: hypothetical protein K8U57_34005 [Planctomycetes bacterium]|nr:hypothetical protein [Planctomycetota bacterium]
MSTKLPKNRIRYAESKVTFLEGEKEQWLKDHLEAQACLKSELFIRDVNQLLQDILWLDSEIQSDYCDGVPHDQSLSEKMEKLISRWYKLAVAVEVGATAFEKKGYSVEGVTDLRRGISEVGALLNPSDEVGGAIAALRDKALQSLNSGETLEGLVD